MKKEKYDFCGWATRNNIRCSDGLVIKKDAFKDNDGFTVPLVWNHNHNDAENVLGHALLENRDDGVYAYCSLNDTEQGRNARELVRHGDVSSLSIYANRLKKDNNAVIHGAIREVSLVLAGANPGAYIETIMAHSDDNSEDGATACIYNNSETLELMHSDENEETNSENVKTETKKVDEVKHSDNEADNKNNEEGNNMQQGQQQNQQGQNGPTIKEIFDTLTDEQKEAVYAIVGIAVQQAKEEDAEGDDGGNENMKHNAFEDYENDGYDGEDVLSHSEFLSIVDEAKRSGSLKDAFLAHGIDDVDVLFPEAQTLANQPRTLDMNESWVGKVMGKVHHSPFSRIKSLYFNITADEARAKGYVKGNKKVEETIAALKRTTTPTTVYKLQKMDRDDIVDITDFDVVAYLKGEMRHKLDQELARAFLIGDGRSISDSDKINAQNIRPILGDDSVYTTARILTRADNATDEEFAKELIKDIKKSRKEYKGAGNPTFYTTEDVLTSMLLIEDTTGRAIYDDVTKLATALRVKEIVTVPPMENCSRTDDEKQLKYNCLGILVNLEDYNVGADKGGAVNMFDDFDIDYNKYAYLIETRCSGALVTPKAAITFEEKISTAPGA